VIVLRAQIVRVLLGSGEFNWGDTRLTAAMLAIFILSLLAQAVLLLLIRAFYARGRTVLPLCSALLSGIFSVGLAFWFHALYTDHPTFQTSIAEFFRLKEVNGVEVLVLALAFMLGQFLQLLVLLILSVRTFHINYQPLVKLLLQSIAAALAGAISAYVTLAFIVDGINQETFIGISIQGVSAGVMGIIAIILIYAVTDSPELNEIHKSFKARIFKTDVIDPQ